MTIDTPAYIAFHRQLSDFYYESGRHSMAWRQAEPDGSISPYKILVSELMLQQTQVGRVEPKYTEFLQHFPSVAKLARAELAQVLTAWNGLGYNRRAQYLWQAAGIIHKQHKDVFPKTSAELQALPGIGPNTAGAIMAYAYDQPVVFLETNVRTVLIHHFFRDKTGIPDKDIRAVLSQLLPGSHEGGAATLGNRQFYWALMDYGSHIKKTVGNKARASRSYTKQSAFHGSKRQLRGRIIRLLTPGPQPVRVVQEQLGDERVEAVIADLVREGMVRRTGGRLQLG